MHSVGDEDELKSDVGIPIRWGDEEGELEPPLHPVAPFQDTD